MVQKIMEVIMLWIKWNEEAIKRGLLWVCNWKMVRSTHFFAGTYISYSLCLYGKCMELTITKNLTIG